MRGRGTRIGSKKGRGYYSTELLLDVLRQIAHDLGRTPGKRDLAKLSRENVSPSYQPYVNRFGSIRNAVIAAGLAPSPARGPIRRQHRFAGPAQRFRIFTRDGFKCVYCGASPSDGARLVIDHLLPYSATGKTVDENLKTACTECNSGKSAMILDLERFVL